MKKHIPIVISIALLICMVPTSPSFGQSTMAITSPNGGEVYSIGSECTVTWSFGNITPISDSAIFISFNGGQTWSKIATVPQNQTYTTWTIPEIAPGTHNAKIRITVKIAQSSFVSDDSDGCFIIVDPTEIPAAPTEFKAYTTKTGTGILLTWRDNSNNEDGFRIWRKKAGENFQDIVHTDANATQFTDSGLSTGTTYIYRIEAVNDGNASTIEEASATTLTPTDEDSLSTLSELPSISAPTELKAILNSDGSIQLSWVDTGTAEKGFKIERNLSGSDTFTQIATVGQNITTYKDTGNFSGTVNYRVRAYSTLSNSTYSNTVSIVPSEPGLSEETETPDSGEEFVLRFYIDNVGYKVNGQTLIADVSPTIKNNRTLLPVRYIATPLGADVSWDPDNEKVTITLDDKKLELWIGNNTAMVNGVSERIDPDNPEVMPEILPPGRTMLPLRFIAEKMGCDVSWDPVLKEVKLTYVKP